MYGKVNSKARAGDASPAPEPAEYWDTPGVAAGRVKQWFGDPEPEPEPELEPEVALSPEPEPDLDYEPEAELDSEPDYEPYPVYEPVWEPEPAPSPRSRLRSISVFGRGKRQPEPAWESEPEWDSEPVDPEPDWDPAASLGTEAEPEPDVEPEPDLEPDPEPAAAREPAGVPALRWSLEVRGAGTELEWALSASLWAASAEERARTMRRAAAVLEEVAADHSEEPELVTGSGREAAIERLRRAELARLAATSELKRLGALRSRSLVGVLGENLAATYYGVELAPPTTPGHDLVTSDGRSVQVRTLQCGPGNLRTVLGELGDDYDVLFAIRLGEDFLPLEAIEVPQKVVEEHFGAGRVAWTQALAEDERVVRLRADDLGG
jgi:hypothetical protein